MYMLRAYNRQFTVFLVFITDRCSFFAFTAPFSFTKMVLGYKPFLASVSLFPLFNHLSTIHSLFRLHLDFEIELPLQSECELHFCILILFQWSVFCCGHCICCQCAWVLLRQAGVGPRHRNVHVKCPMCRIPTIAQEISYVSTARTQTEESRENISVKVPDKILLLVRLGFSWALREMYLNQG